MTAHRTAVRKLEPAAELKAKRRLRGSLLPGGGRSCFRAKQAPLPPSALLNAEPSRAEPSRGAPFIARLSLTQALKFLTPGLTRPQTAKKTKALNPLSFLNEFRAFHQSGRQDLNLRPLGPEGRSAATHPFSPAPPAPLASQALATSGEGTALDPHRLAGFPPIVTPLTAPVRRRFELPEELLTVAEVAPLLRVCKATVYRMVKDGSLQAVHVLNGVRIRRSALAEFAMMVP